MRGRAAGTIVALALVAGCSGQAEAEPEQTASTPTHARPSAPTPAPTATPSPSTAPETDPEPEPVLATTGRPREARLSIPALGLVGLRVVPYVGTPDDGPGTVIQDDGSAASPHGSGGLVGPGGIGNYLVTGHRSSSTAPFRYLPSLRVGARIIVRDRDPSLGLRGRPHTADVVPLARVAARAVGRRPGPPRP